ncbi:ABC transporter substrate-binding protein [Anaerorhabdus furcosa]|uniref:Iron(III) transport system substrate-binding protein n=1 Tax=Anaerorhabdus furcosa TaxID=118967 RepID=A0A1T4JY87_9FIRM|nr:extracellular solute-binding protein [Anaerorhabdus furcosa]SJZ35079.1 iron(III) transport system substrate-binding protein [Anaerorhabdus furcosa]
MKKFLSLVLMAAMLLSVAGCSSPAKPAESTPSGDAAATGKLVVYSPNSEGLMNSVIPLFEETYGVEVEVIQAGTGELIKRIQSEKDDPYADIMFGGAHSQYISNPDLWESYVSPADATLPEAYQNKSGFTTSYVLDGSVLIVNKDLIGDIKIESYEDLLNPALKGKIAMGDPATSSSAFAQLTNILLAMGGYESEEAWDYVGKLIEQLDGKVASGSSAVYKSVADGEMIVGLSYEDPCAQLVRDGANVELVYPTEGAVYLPATSGIIKGAKNMDNAKKFIDFILTPEVQDIFGTTLTNRPALAEAQTADYMTPIAEITTIDEDREWVNSNKDALATKYTDLFASLQK